MVVVTRLSGTLSGTSALARREVTVLSTTRPVSVSIDTVAERFAPSP